MSIPIGPDTAPTPATRADIDILSHELYVASRRIFGDVFPRVPGEYSRTLDVTDCENFDPDVDPSEFELTAEVESRPGHQEVLRVVKYGLAVVAFAASQFEGYKTGISQEYTIRPVGLTAYRRNKFYLYSECDEGRGVITLDEAFLQPSSFPDGERPRRRPRYDESVKRETERLGKDDLEFIYSCLSKSGCYEREMADHEGMDDD